MLELSICIIRLNVTKPNFLDICNLINIGSFVFTLWNVTLMNMPLCLTQRRHSPGCFLAVPPNANGCTVVFSSGISYCFLNTLCGTSLLMAPVWISAFTYKVCYVRCMFSFFFWGGVSTSDTMLSLLVALGIKTGSGGIPVFIPLKLTEKSLSVFLGKGFLESFIKGDYLGM